MKVTTEAVQVFGGYGYTKDYPVERYIEMQRLHKYMKEHKRFRGL